MAQRVGDGVELAVEVDEGAGVEFLEAERFVVEEGLSFRVGGDEDLEPAIEEEAVDEVGADTATNAVGGFKEEEWDVFGAEVGGGGQACQASSDDDDSSFGGYRRGKGKGGGGGLGRLESEAATWVSDGVAGKTCSDGAETHYCFSDLVGVLAGDAMVVIMVTLSIS